MNPGSENTPMPFPFIDRFHLYFLERQWNSPGIPTGERHTLHSKKNEDGKESTENYSKHSGDYYHFMNVVFAMAWLIMYFQNGNKIFNCIFQSMLRVDQEKDEIKELCGTLAYEAVYGTIPNPRTFMLMLAAFYHDLGKTIVDHRHGMEGAIILSDHTSSSWYQLNQIVKQYPEFKEQEFEQDDLLFVSDLLFYHDVFGTLSTGETGYLRLVDVIDRIKRYSLKHTGKAPIDKEVIKQWSQRYLFDLWLLNVADIMTSIPNKQKHQPEWNDEKKAQERIEKFFSRPDKPPALRHDLIIARRILDTYGGKTHADNISVLEKKAATYSGRHAIERIRRLIYASLTTAIRGQISQKEYRNDQEREDVLRRIFSVQNEPDLLDDEQFYKCSIEKMSSHSNINSTILKAIQSVDNFRDFCVKFSWIGQMDYALGFFIKIASRSLKLVCDELDGSGQKTKLISDKGKTAIAGGNNEFYLKIQANFFVNNYTVIVIQILSHLLSREKAIDRLRNIEFKEATDRLNEEKIDTILSLNGIYRSKRTIQLILQTVFLY